MLREKAGQITNGITFVLLGILTVVLAARGIETWVVVAVGGTAILQLVLFTIFQLVLLKKN